eukprot:4639477-Pleurochrysis_carterae.AAC.1
MGVCPRACACAYVCVRVRTCVCVRERECAYVRRVREYVEMGYKHAQNQHSSSGGPSQRHA